MCFFDKQCTNVLNFVGFVPWWVSWVPCHNAFVGPKYFFMDISWVQFFSRGCFVSPRFFLVGISWVQHFFSWGFPVSVIFSRRYFNFFLWVFHVIFKINTTAVHIHLARSQYIALFVISGSIKKLFKLIMSIFITFPQYFFNRFCLVEVWSYTTLFIHIQYL